MPTMNRCRDFGQRICQVRDVGEILQPRQHNNMIGVESATHIDEFTQFLTGCIIIRAGNY